MGCASSQPAPKQPGKKSPPKTKVTPAREPPAKTTEPQKVESKPLEAAKEEPPTEQPSSKEQKSEIETKEAKEKTLEAVKEEPPTEQPSSKEQKSEIETKVAKEEPPAIPTEDTESNEAQTPPTKPATIKLNETMDMSVRRRELNDTKDVSSNDQPPPTKTNDKVKLNESLSMSVKRNEKPALQSVETNTSMPVLKSSVEVSVATNTTSSTAAADISSATDVQLPAFEDSLATAIACEEQAYTKYRKSKDINPTGEVFFKTLDAYVRRPLIAELGALKRNVPKLAEYLTRYCKTDIGKTRAIFVFTTVAINYDTDAINNNSTPDCSTQSVLLTGKSVCEGFASVMQSLGEACGLEILKLHGYAKGINYKNGMKYKDTNHAWNCVNIEGEWRFFDNTWAEGDGEYVDGKMIATKRYQNEWFDVCAEVFAFSHYSPDTPSIPSIDFLTKSEFESIKYSHMTAWMSPSDLRAIFSNKSAPLPTSLTGKFNIIKAPVFLKVGRTYTFKVKNLQTDGDRGVAFRCGKDFQQVKQAPDGYCEATYSPKKVGDAVLFVLFEKKVNGNTTSFSFSHCIEYVVMK